MYFQKPVGLEGQWRPLHCGGFCPGPSPAKWEAAKTAVPAVERGRGEGSPGGSGGGRGTLWTGAPIRFESRSSLAVFGRHPLPFIIWACVLPVSYLTCFPVLGFLFVLFQSVYLRKAIALSKYN